MTSRIADRPIRQLHRRRRHGRRRRRDPRAALLPLRPAALLLHPRRLPRRHQRHPAAARPRRCILSTVERQRVTKLFCPPTVWISLLRSPGFDTTRSVVAAQGLLRRLGDARRGAHASSANGSPASALLELLRPDRDGPAGHHPPTPRAAHPLGSAGRAEHQRRDPHRRRRRPARSQPATVGEIVHRSPQAMTGYWNDAAKTAEAFRRRLVPLRRSRRHGRRRLPRRSSTARRT